MTSTELIICRTNMHSSAYLFAPVMLLRANLLFYCNVCCYMTKFLFNTGLVGSLYHIGKILNKNGPKGENCNKQSYERKSSIKMGQKQKFVENIMHSV